MPQLAEIEQDDAYCRFCLSDSIVKAYWIEEFEAFVDMPRKVGKPRKTGVKLLKVFREQWWPVCASCHQMIEDDRLTLLVGAVLETTPSFETEKLQRIYRNSLLITYRRFLDSKGDAVDIRIVPAPPSAAT